MKILKRAWIPPVVAVALARGGFAVDRLQGIFPIINSAKLDTRSKTPPYAPKSATYEIIGPPGTVGVVNWMDENAQPRRENFTTLPWSHTITAEEPLTERHNSVTAMGSYARRPALPGACTEVV